MNAIDEILQPGNHWRRSLPHCLPTGNRMPPLWASSDRATACSYACFPGSQTFRNVSETGKLTINIVDDPRVFVLSAFGDLEDSYFEPRQGTPPLVKGAYAWVSCEAIVDGTVRLKPLKSEVVRRQGTYLQPGIRSRHRCRGHRDAVEIPRRSG